MTRPSIAGKFFVHNKTKFFIKGVTYGTFRPLLSGEEYALDLLEYDFRQIAAHGFNTVRTYTVPPRKLLDVASRHGLFVMIGLPWEQHIAFLDEPDRRAAIEAAVSSGVERCAGHPAVVSYTIGNEIPASIVRYHGARRIERHIERLYRLTKEHDPSALVTYVNYPTTEYLDLCFLDFLSFNVYIESQDRLDAYVARLQNIAGDRPLVMAEIGLDSRRNGEAAQARILEWQVRTVFAAGCAGALVFAWTDEWYRGGYDIEDWDFGLTRRDRTPKIALAAVSESLKELPLSLAYRPRVSVIVCTYSGARTICDCLEGLQKLIYPNYEVIVVDDGSTDETAALASQYNCRLIRTENCGLSSARNTGFKEATGEIIAYLDDDAWPDPHWLTYLVDIFGKTAHAGVGGPNIPPGSDGPLADCVANAPGGPVHVLFSDREAEHIPGCNMAFRRICLEAIGGFDVQFRAAGDDVDICWRLQEHGWTIGFHPSAIVWHHRRNSIPAYWRQQRGYGKAEALLERKWPEKYQPPGSITWGGRIYGTGLYTLATTRIYHGTWGAAPFQSLYQPSPSLLRSIPLMPEWYLLLTALFMLSLLSLSWSPLAWALPIFIAGVGLTVVQAWRGARRARFTVIPYSRWASWQLRCITAFLYLLQPLARLTGRLRHGLTPWRRHTPLTVVWPRQRIIKQWRERHRDPEKILKALEGALRGHRAVTRRGGNFDRWDLEVRTGLAGRARLIMAVEEHDAGKQLLRFRIWPKWSASAIVFGLIGGGLAAAAADDAGIVAASVLVSTSAALLLWTFRDCASAMSVSRQCVEKFWPESRDRK